MDKQILEVAWPFSTRVALLFVDLQTHQTHSATHQTQTAHGPKLLVAKGVWDLLEGPIVEPESATLGGDISMLQNAAQ